MRMEQHVMQRALPVVESHAEHAPVPLSSCTTTVRACECESLGSHFERTSWKKSHERRETRLPKLT
jgi:hypothetical protein